MAKKSQNASVIGKTRAERDAEKVLVMAQCVNAHPDRGWVQGELVGYEDGFALVRGEMVSFRNAHPDSKGLHGVWKCRKDSVS